MLSPLTLLAVLAAAAPPLSPTAELAALKSAANSEIGAVNSVLQTPVEPAHKPALREAVDSVVREADSCARAAGALDALLPEPRAFVEGQLRGPKSLDTRVDAALGERDRVLTRLAAARKGTAALKKRADDETDPKKKKRLEALFEDAEEALARAGAAVSSLEAACVVLDPLRQEGKTRARRFQASAADYAGLSKELAGLPPSMAEPAAALKARIELLGAEPQAENRTRFNQALNPLLDPARNLYARSNSAHDAFDRASDDYAKAVSLLKDFDSSLASVERRKMDAYAALAALEAILEKGA